MRNFYWNLFKNSGDIDAYMAFKTSREKDDKDGGAHGSF